MAELKTIAAAEAGWNALYGEHEDESRSRILAWALHDTGETVGLVVDPADKRKIVPATNVGTPDGQPFTRYGFSST